MPAVTPRRLAPGERVVFRSGPVLRTSVILTVMLVAGALLGWYALEPGIRALFTWPQVATLIFFVLLMAGIMLTIGFSNAVVTAEGITVRNVLHTKRYGWDEVVDVTLASGEAWANVVHLVDDGETDSSMLLAIQRAEGPGAAERVADFRALIAAHSTAPGAVESGPDAAPTSESSAD